MWKLLAVLVLSGCATMGRALQPQDAPGVYVTDNKAAVWGCRGEYVRLAATDYAKKLPAGKVYIPQVGWDVCELLARVGDPREVELQQSQYGRSASLWYGSPSDPHLVTIEQQGSKWVIDYVGW